MAVLLSCACFAGCRAAVVVTVHCFTPGHFFGVCLWVLELGHLGWACLAWNTNSLEPFWCLSVWHSSPVVLFGMCRPVHPQQAVVTWILVLGSSHSLAVWMQLFAGDQGTLQLKVSPLCSSCSASDPMSSCFVPGARSVWIVQLCQPNKWMCIHTSTFLWSLLCAHLVRSAYLTLERALESFSKFWCPLQLVTMGLVCSCATKHKCNQHSFVWQTEMWRGIRGNQEDSHE